MSPLGVVIYHNQSRVKNWEPKIHCRRRQDKIDWFELGFEITANDLAVIARSNLETGQSFSSEGMVLLDPKQRSLLKFLKRYLDQGGKLKKAKLIVEEGVVEKNGEEYRRFHLPFRRTQIFDLFELKKLGFDEVLSQEEVQFCENLLNLKGMPRYDLPQKLKCDLRPYQVDGYQWLYFLWKNRFGACLADDMGLGKTVQVISFLEAVIGQVSKVLIVCPVSILVNWQEEFAKFSSLSDEICLYYGGNRELESDKKIILTSYGIMKREAEGELNKIDFDVMVLDEVQNLKNHRSLASDSARKIKAKFHICLTGTPVENDLSEFYNIIDLAVPGILGGGSRAMLDVAGESRAMAKKLARPFVLRRTKSQVLQDLPPKVDNTVYLKFSDQERECYVHQLRVIKERIEKIPSNHRYGEVFKGLLELRQLCLWQQFGDLYSTKVNFLFRDLEQILQEQHQVLIFSQFTTYLNIIQKRLVEKEIAYSRIDGSYSIKKRAENVRLFQSGENKVFLISLKAGGLGLNLTAASYVYIMDPWWNPAVEAQAIDRTHRIGQKKSVNIYRLIMKNSVEEKVLELQKIKRKLFEDLLGSEGDEYFTGKLTMKDFEALLSG